MNKFIKPMVIVLAVLLAVSIISSCVISNYNGITELDEQVSAQWAQVEAQYQRRYDLIPNLVATVKGYASHETEVFTGLAEARSKAGGVINIDESVLSDEEKMAQFQNIQDSLGASLQRLLSVTENYPELQSNQNFLALQDELEGTENRISVERKRYNDLVSAYNKKIRKFPGNIWANMYGFEKKAYFKASENAQNAPEVKF